MLRTLATRTGRTYHYVDGAALRTLCGRDARDMWSPDIRTGERRCCNRCATVADQLAEIHGSQVVRTYYAPDPAGGPADAPSDDPYCATHGVRFDPAVGCPQCLADTDPADDWARCDVYGHENDGAGRCEHCHAPLSAPADDYRAAIRCPGHDRYTDCEDYGPEETCTACDAAEDERLTRYGD